MDETIYKNYSVTDVILNKPCNLDDVNIYPIKVRKWSDFQRYTIFLLFSKEHLKISEEESLITGLIANAIKYYNNGEIPENKDVYMEIFTFVLKEICDMISIVTKMEDVTYNIIEKNIDFTLNKTLKINEKNFNIFREIVLRQNLLFEPTIYKSKLQAKWAEKTRKGRAKKNKGLSFFEMINIVRSELHISYDDIGNLNFFQLYTDFLRISNTKEFEALTILKTTYGIQWDKLPNIDFNDKMLNKLLKNPEDDLFKDINTNEIM